MGNITYSPSTWTNGNVTITAKATDTGSGISYYQFSTSSSLTASSSGWTSITNTKSETTQTYSASANGTYYFYVKDASGNINKKSVALSKIDKTKPTITTPTASAVAETSITLSTTFNDANSGLSKIVVYYKKDTASSYSSQTTTYTTMNGSTTGSTGSQTKSISLTGLSDGTTYNIYVIGYDVAGNSIQSSTASIATESAIRPGKIYKIVSALNSNLVLDVSNGSLDNSANIQIYTWNKTDAQKWELYDAGNGNYGIINLKANKAVDIKSGSSSDGANIQTYDWGKTNQAQIWTLEDAGNGYFYIKSTNKGKYIDVHSGLAQNSENVSIYTKSSATSQKWKLVEVDSEITDIKYSAKITNITTSSYDVVISNITSSSSISSVQICSWSKNRGQDDLVTTNATLQSDGTYKATVSRSAHTDSGVFHTYAKVTNSAGTVKTINVGRVKLTGYGKWYGDSTYYTTRVWTRISDYNGTSTVYSIDVMWRYQQDVGNNKTQVEAAQIRFNQHISGWGMAGCTLTGGTGIGGNNGTGTATISGNPPNSFTISPYKYATISHDSVGAFNSNIQWLCYVGNSTDSHRPTFTSWQSFKPGVRNFDQTAIGETDY